MKINENHRRIIRITLYLLDEMLCRLEQWAKRHEIHSTLFEEINTLSDSQCESLLKEIEGIRTTLAQVKEDLALEANSEVVGKNIAAMCLLFITDNLDTLKGNGLSDFGQVSPKVTAYLDPKLDEIIGRLQEIIQIGKASVQSDVQENP
jgi:hypothetical protein